MRRRIAKQVRAMLGDAPVGRLCRTRQACDKDAFFTCLPQAGSSRYVPCPLHGGACPRNLRVDLTCARANATLGKLHLDRRTWS